MTWLNRNTPPIRGNPEDTSQYLVQVFNSLVCRKMQLPMFEEISMLLKNSTGLRVVRLHCSDSAGRAWVWRAVTILPGPSRAV
jgi:hypothetical protein